MAPAETAAPSDKDLKSIAEARGVRMPSFFAYFGWAMLVLTPIYALITVLLF